MVDRRDVILVDQIESFAVVGRDAFGRRPSFRRRAGREPAKQTADNRADGDHKKGNNCELAIHSDSNYQYITLNLMQCPKIEWPRTVCLWQVALQIYFSAAKIYHCLLCHEARHLDRHSRI